MDRITMIRRGDGRRIGTSQAVPGNPAIARCCNPSATWLLTMTALILSGCAGHNLPRVAQQKEDATWRLADTPLDRPAAVFRNQAAEHLAWAGALRQQIVSTHSPRTVENTLVPYNDMMMHIDAVAAESSLFARVHPNAMVRKVAEEAEQEAQKFATGLKLDRDVYDAFAELDVRHADKATQYLTFKILREFRRAGVDRDERTREHIARLNEEIVLLGQEFARNIRDDDREIMLDSPADLAGMPQDWVDKHPPAPDGRIRITTRYPDYYPFLTYAENADARRRLYVEFKNRGFPANVDVLDRLLSRRHELARILGSDSWADYITADKMIGSAANAHAFIDRIAELLEDNVVRDREALLARKRRDAPAAVTIEEWEKGFYERVVKEERFAFDPQEMRPYFNFPDVMQGLFDLTGRLFGISYEQVHGLDLWHDDVTAWDVVEGGQRIGRFYLDLHPRENKYGHAAQFDYRTGIAGKRLPQAALVCNFPNPRDSQDGLALMEHSEVVTFFHEFGHLLHTIFAGHRRWMGNSGITMEWDFVEAPSQMLEEWCFQPDALRTFARHHETREPIPDDLVAKLQAARFLGKSMWAAHQMFYAAVSLNYYNRDPDEFDTATLAVELQRHYSPYPYVDGTHVQCGFGHLDHYSAIYYTYMWSLVIATDLFQEFEQNGIMNSRTARAYRDKVLAPGGSKPAADLIQDFLGRPYSFEAFEHWLSRS